MSAQEPTGMFESEVSTNMPQSMPMMQATTGTEVVKSTLGLDLLCGLVFRPFFCVLSVFAWALIISDFALRRVVQHVLPAPANSSRHNAAKNAAGRPPDRIAAGE